MTFAFVLMPFDQESQDLYRLGIKEPAADLGVRAERVDEQLFSEGILERIYRQIDAADIVIAEMTGKNANVFYEVGYAHGRGKLCILSTADVSDIPFDLKHRRHIVHGNSILTLRERISEELRWAKGEVENVRTSRIQVRPPALSGSLEKTKFNATAVVHARIDLVNESKRPSSQVESLYFHSGEGWRLTQDGRECPSAASDIPGYSLSHFLSAPLRRLQPAAWAQISFVARKVVGSTWKGDVLNDSYRIAGRAMLRLVTEDGTLDHELYIDVSCDEIPF